jgi:hypothetical protein
MISSPISAVVRSRSGASTRKGLGGVHDGFQLAGRHGPLFAGAQQAAEHLLPVEALAAAVFLDHHVGDFVDALVGGEAAIAALALPPPPDGVGLFALARVHHPILPETAIGHFIQETHPEHLFKECSHFCELVSHPSQMPRILEIAIQTALAKTRRCRGGNARRCGALRCRQSSPARRLHQRASRRLFPAGKNSIAWPRS